MAGVAISVDSDMTATQEVVRHKESCFERLCAHPAPTDCGEEANSRDRTKASVGSPRRLENVMAATTVRPFSFPNKQRGHGLARQCIMHT